MDYNRIDGFLERFKKLLSHSEAAHTVIAETITKHITIPIEAKMIKIKGSVIHIQGSPMLKSEIFMHAQGILSDLKELLPDRNFTALR